MSSGFNVGGGGCLRCNGSPGVAKGKNNTSMPSLNALRGDMTYDNGGMTEEEMITKTIAWLLREWDLYCNCLVFSCVVVLMLMPK
jgi:hypothetical protein